MKVTQTEFEGLFILTPNVFEDVRGIFVKTYNAQTFEDAGIPFEPKEEFYSISRKDVVRGMHFQTGVAAHDKLVFPTNGRVLDVVLDLRRKSRTFGKHFARQLEGSKREMLFIPAGFAHGFLSLADGTLMVYQTSTGHSPANDAGIRWDSFGYSWPVSSPVISDRDLAFPVLNDFQSPF